MFVVLFSDTDDNTIKQDKQDFVHNDFTFHKKVRYSDTKICFSLCLSQKV